MSGKSLSAASQDGAFERISAAPRPYAGFWYSGLAAAILWGALALLMFLWPDKSVGFVKPRYVTETNILVALFATTILALTLLEPLPGLRLLVQPLTSRIRNGGRWLIVLALLTALWEIVTAKLALLPAPFFAPPHALIEAYVTDWPRLSDSVLHSLRLLALGFLFGSLSGFMTGVAIGWSQALGYWVHPVLRFLGPVPSTALLPLSLYFFPSSFSAAIFLIALATWFPVTVLTWSGVASVDKNYYDVALTLGASPIFLILRVAIPASLPYVFTGLFMGLGASFSVLVAAEMMGVKSGLGWYLQWAQGWAAYANMYGALIVMALLFSSLITLLFAVRDRLLAWQKGAVKW
ncbi:ABC transporter permease subunit [Affinibrenneria salicis]|uniref:ABC transporter permease subunit n=1 Tax=Affinibrenneria salicis TaxID=2590031 RepID=A0A5J5G576_9GAMM|nr:ABC transporter permease subunit [Affinibrenneria salicis]KAA9002024.1 ABC transporter permease subunit [Affinibrenneria salicis]